VIVGKFAKKIPKVGQMSLPLDAKCSDDLAVDDETGTHIDLM